MVRLCDMIFVLADNICHGVYYNTSERNGALISLPELPKRFDEQ
jgi:hypothetical protein